MMKRRRFDLSRPASSSRRRPTTTRSIKSFSKSINKSAMASVRARLRVSIRFFIPIIMSPVVNVHSLSFQHTTTANFLRSQSHSFASQKSVYCVVAEIASYRPRARESVKECVKKLFKRFLIPINLSRRIVAWICARRLGIASHKRTQYTHTWDVIGCARWRVSSPLRWMWGVKGDFREIPSSKKKECLSLSVKSVSEELWLRDFN